MRAGADGAAGTCRQPFNSKAGMTRREFLVGGLTCSRIQYHRGCAQYMRELYKEAVTDLESAIGDNLSEHFRHDWWDGGCGADVAAAFG